MSELLAKLAENGGPLGIGLGLSYLYIRQLHKEIREVENKRVTDQQSMVSKLLELNDKWNETLNTQVEAQEAQKQLLADLKMTLLDHPRLRR